MVRDSYKRGITKELKLMDTINNYSDWNCQKNSDPYDIDLIVHLTKGRKILIEVEETGKRYWPSISSKPSYPSGLLTMPIRKIKYFISDFKKIEKASFNSLEDFFKFYPKTTIFKPRSNKNEIRIYVKGSYNLKYICIVTEDIIVKSLNSNLADQQYVNRRIRKLKQDTRWIFYNNLWFNPEVKNMKGKKREDPILLILGTIQQKKNGIIWEPLDNIVKILEKLKKQKWHNK